MTPEPEVREPQHEMLPAGNVEQPQYGDLVVACVICQRKKPVLLYPHRLGGQVVGWVFVCADDQGWIQGADVLIQTYPKPHKVTLGSGVDA
jgi:hypothetical protein